MNSYERGIVRHQSDVANARSREDEMTLVVTADDAPGWCVG